MRVYIVCEDIPYEGIWLGCGVVCKSLEIAQRELAARMAKRSKWANMDWCIKEIDYLEE